MTPNTGRRGDNTKVDGVDSNVWKHTRALNPNRPPEASDMSQARSRTQRPRDTSAQASSTRDWRYGYARGIGLEAHLPTADHTTLKLWLTPGRGRRRRRSNALQSETRAGNPRPRAWKRQRYRREDQWHNILAASRTPIRPQVYNSNPDSYGDTDSETVPVAK